MKIIHLGVIGLAQMIQRVDQVSLRTGTSHTIPTREIYAWVTFSLLCTTTGYTIPLFCGNK